MLPGRPIGRTFKGRRGDEVLRREISAGRETSKLVASCAMEAHQRVEDLLRALVLRADHAGEATDPSEIELQLGQGLRVVLPGRPIGRTFKGRRGNEVRHLETLRELASLLPLR